MKESGDTGPQRHREQPGMLSSQPKHTVDSGGERKQCVGVTKDQQRPSVGVAVDPSFCGSGQSGWRGMNNTESRLQLGPSLRPLSTGLCLSFALTTGCLSNFDTFPLKLTPASGGATRRLV